MKSLSKAMKDIYTSGNKYTVLQLLEKLIEEVEKTETTVAPLYRHTIRVTHSILDNPYVATAWFTVYTTEDVAIDSVAKLHTYMASNGNRVPASGYLTEDGETYYNVYAILSPLNDEGNIRFACPEGNQELSVTTIIDYKVDVHNDVIQ